MRKMEEYFSKVMTNVQRYLIWKSGLFTVSLICFVFSKMDIDLIVDNLYLKILNCIHYIEHTKLLLPLCHFKQRQVVKENIIKAAFLQSHFNSCSIECKCICNYAKVQKIQKKSPKKSPKRNNAKSKKNIVKLNKALQNHVNLTKFFLY